MTVVKLNGVGGIWGMDFVITYSHVTMVINIIIIIIILQVKIEVSSMADMLTCHHAIKFMIKYSTMQMYKS